MPKETISIKLNCTPEIYRIIMRRQAKEKEKRCRVFSLESAALKIIEESEHDKYMLGISNNIPELMQELKSASDKKITLNE